MAAAGEDGAKSPTRAVTGSQRVGRESWADGVNRSDSQGRRPEGRASGRRRGAVRDRTRDLATGSVTELRHGFRHGPMENGWNH